MPPDENLTDFENPYAAPNASEFETAEKSVDDFGTEEFHPFISIWLHPRRTIRRIVATNPERHVILLTCLIGIGQTLARDVMRNAGYTRPVASIINRACVIGPLSGLLSMWIISHLVYFTGRWIGGTGQRQHLKTAIAWASVPLVLGLVLWVPRILLFGSDAFTRHLPNFDFQPAYWVLFVMLDAADYVLGTSAIVLVCNTIAEVQGYRSAWRGLGNLVMAMSMFIIPYTIIALCLMFL